MLHPQIRALNTNVRHYLLQFVFVSTYISLIKLTTVKGLRHGANVTRTDGQNIEEKRFNRCRLEAAKADYNDTSGAHI